MGTASPAKTWNIEAIVEKGLQTIGETVAHMNSVDLDDRDLPFAKALTAFVEAAIAIGKDQRDAAKWMRDQKIGEADLRSMLVECLKSMPRDDLASLLAQVGTAEKQAS